VSGFKERARAYFRDRAIYPAAVAKAGVCEQAGAIVFPFLAEDGTSFERRRSLDAVPAKVMQPRGWPLVPWWPAGRPDTAPWVLVCEGESDALAAMSALARTTPYVPARLGLADLPVIAVPGTGFPPKKLAEALVSVGAQEVRLAFDGDEAGAKATDRAAVELVKAGIRTFVVHLPEGSDLADRAKAADHAGEWIANAIYDAEPTIPYATLAALASKAGWAT